MFDKLFHFLKGYVIIEVYGSDLERFLNICVRRKLDISNAQRNADGTITLHISASDFRQLRPVAFKTKTRVRILEKYGLHNIRKSYKKFYGFASGIAFAILFFALTSQYIWVVEINGVYYSDYEQIAEILASDGIYTGAKKKNIKEKAIIKQNLVNATDTISWAWVYIEGAKARVEIYEKNLPSIPMRSNEPCDIVAARDGFVEQITTISGNDLVQSGTAVEQGDIIISGKVPVFKPYDEEERYIYVPSEGIVQATTTHKLSGRYSLLQKTEVPTGRESRFVSFEIFGKLFYLFGMDTPEFESYKTSYRRHELNLPFWGYSGLCITEKICAETQVKEYAVSSEEAVEIAKNDLEEKIAKELLSNAKLINSEIDCKNIDDATIEVTLTMTVSEDIGIKQPINENPNKQEE